MLAKQALYCLNHLPVHFALVILKMGSHKLFVHSVLKLQSYLSLLRAKITGMSHRHPARNHF
jgi:hypothetical protein